jgi:hypothetical protein
VTDPAALRRLRLWARLIRLAWLLIRRPARLHALRVVSEVEAIHRDLGHSHNASLILPEHTGRLT